MKDNARVFRGSDEPFDDRCLVRRHQNDGAALGLWMKERMPQIERKELEKPVSPRHAKGIVDAFWYDWEILFSVRYTRNLVNGRDTGALNESLEKCVRAGRQFRTSSLTRPDSRPVEMADGDAWIPES